jgi:hypothetical protein
MSYAASDLFCDGIEIAYLALIDPHAQAGRYERISQLQCWSSILAPVAYEQIKNARTARVFSVIDRNGHGGRIEFRDGFRNTTGVLQKMAELLGWNATSSYRLAHRLSDLHRFEMIRNLL